MSDAFDLTTLFFLALAVIIFLRLRGVLGRRTGHERPPYDPYAPRDAVKGDEKAKEGNVITMPGTPKIEKADQENERAAAGPPVWQGHAEPGTPLAAGLEAIAREDRSFDVGHFLDGAKMAYEMIVTAFADGDRKTLRSLLSKEVFANFDAAITERQQRNETVESSFVGIEKASVVDADVKERRATVTVRFASELISATRDANGEVIEGDPKRVRDVVDIWTFARDLGSRDPNWQLIATESGQ